MAYFPKKSSYTAIMIAVSTAVLLTLGSCAKNESKALVGSWQAEVDLADACMDVASNDAALRNMMDLDSFPTKLNFIFTKDGTCTLSLDEESYEQASDAFRSTLNESIASYLKEVLACDDAGLDDFLASQELALDDLSDDVLSNANIRGLFSHAPDEQTYVAMDGKLYLLGEGETEPGTDTEYFTYEISGSKLTLTGTTMDRQEFPDLFPTIFEQKASSPR